MKNFKSVRFDPSCARLELQEFKSFLSVNPSFKERGKGGVQRFFQDREQLCALLGYLHRKCFTPDRLAFELVLQGDFQCDLAVGDSSTHSFCLIEFEPAKKNCIFTKEGNKSRRRWSPALEKGFGQIVDWNWRLSKIINAPDCRSLFDCDRPSIISSLVIGRSSEIQSSSNPVKPSEEEERFDWRSQQIEVGGEHVYSYTYDSLFSFLLKKTQY
ncbi:MAG: DUF4263 domain-containing protein [Candidatus Sumerlaeota bacterium]|nr:DUF4263 domain-containing protein [Candidatus Sumerlaeota bacterium]